MWQALRRRGFRGNAVIVPAPSDKVRTSVVECPRTDAAGAIDAIVKSEISRAHNVAARDFESAWWALPRRGGGGPASVLASACGHDAAEAIAGLIESAGAELQTLDLRPLALARAAEHLLTPGGQALDAIVEIGWDASRVVVVGMGCVLYVRELADCGLSWASDQLVKDLGVERDVAERLLAGAGAERSDSALARLARSGVDHIVAMIARELEMSVSYAVRQFGIEQTGRALLMGAGHDAPGAEEQFGQATGLDVISWEAPGGACEPALAAAWGLAARFND